MTEPQEFCLRWNNHQATIISVFDYLLENETLVDCTLAAEGQYLKAHKVVLCACSPYLEILLSQHNDKHPILIFKDIKYHELKCMIEYMYKGEVNIAQDQLNHFLKAAESLQIKGLSESEEEPAPQTAVPTPRPPPPRAPPVQRTQPRPFSNAVAVRSTGPSEDDVSKRLIGRTEAQSPTPRKRRRQAPLAVQGRSSISGDDASNASEGHFDQSNCDVPTPSHPTPSDSSKAVAKVESSSELMLEPKTEYDDNDNSVEDITLDDDDEDYSQAGTSQMDNSQGNFGAWQQMVGDQTGDEVFSGQESGVQNSQDNVLIKVPVSWKIVPIVAPMSSSEKEIALAKTKSTLSPHKKSAKQNARSVSKNNISNKIYNFKEPKVPQSITPSSKVSLKTLNSISTNSSVANANTRVLSPNKFTKPNTIHAVNTQSKKLFISDHKQSSSVDWKNNSPKSFILEDVIKTNNFNITKFSKVISSDSGATCLDSVTLTYPVSEVNDKNDIVIDSGYNNEKNQSSNIIVDTASLEKCELIPFSLNMDTKSDSKQLESRNISISVNTESTKSPEQCILNPKKKLIERAKHSMNNSEEIFLEDKNKAKTVLENQNVNKNIDNNNLKSLSNLSQQSEKHPPSQSISKVRKVYKHLATLKTNSTDVNNTHSFSPTTKNALAINGRINNRNKNNVKFAAVSAPNIKTTKHKKSTKKDILNFRRKMKSPPIPESIKNMKIKEVYPDHWNCVYCSKDITYNDIYEHSTTCLHIDTDEYGKHLICCICKYATMKLSNLRKHIWTHTGEKPFKCNKCSYNSTQSSNLRMHLKIKHGIINIIN